jgi:DNA-binding LacI/PurR family transcriptional regulator
MMAEHNGTLPGIRRSLEAMLRRSKRPTALLVTRPGTALFVASELIRRGFRLPEDLSLVCRDTDRFLEYFVPNIARYEVNPRSHAQRLARLVLQCVGGAVPRAQRVRLMPQFRRGESVGPPPARVGSGGEFR